jgi:hypothetical protein
VGSASDTVFLGPCNDPPDQQLYYELDMGETGVRSLLATGAVTAADVYFLVDATSTMSEELSVLQSSITTATAAILSRAGTARFGLGIFRDYSAQTSTAGPGTIFHHYLDLTSSTSSLVNALNVVDIQSLDADSPDAQSQAIYTAITGTVRASQAWSPGAPTAAWATPASIRRTPCPSSC